MQALLDRTNLYRQTLLREMITLATDDVKFQRRFRMLKQIAELEAQAIDKMRRFETDQAQDIIDGTRLILDDLDSGADRNG